MGHTGNSNPRHMLEEGAFGRALFRQPHPYLQMDLGALRGPKEWACSVYHRRMSLSSLVLHLVKMQREGLIPGHSQTPELVFLRHKLASAILSQSWHQENNTPVFSQPWPVAF